MTAEDVLRYKKAVPFVPFQITMADGRRYTVHDRFMVLTNRRVASVGIPGPNDPPSLAAYAEHLPLREIVSIEPLPAVTA
jgi:hypothetical protein